ncbi:hypothetical protein [Mucilaginibacter sp. AK015]|uniref:hypothetical protein n=1 Tax=Mucilaginibacter sp. AK015 TaxID=2723072 RepID=UPI0016181A2B|nr:hypothetical protein [Mucilaginibacter sp. AK015]MBB5397923.1 translation initiation factor IF-3 [Mucilaginibacter sp. AK015]
MKTRVALDQVEYQEKLGHLIRFFEMGEAVKVTVMFRGREITHPERGEELLRSFAIDLKDLIEPGTATVRDGRSVHAVFTPKGR